MSMARPFHSTSRTSWRSIPYLSIEHRANRDELGTAEQLGWVPPTPAYLVRMALAKRRAKRSPVVT
jgi:hypothetical protein